MYIVPNSRCIFSRGCSLASGTLSSQSIFVQLASTKSTVDSVHKLKIEAC